MEGDPFAWAENKSGHVHIEEDEKELIKAITFYDERASIVEEKEVKLTDKHGKIKYIQIFVFDLNQAIKILNYFRIVNIRRVGLI